MVAHETYEGLYTSFLTVRHSGEAHVTRQVGTIIRHKGLGHCSHEKLKSSLKHAHGFNKEDEIGHETFFVTCVSVQASAVLL